ncbi:CU044_5270 family protein [Sinosporangium siamense]|uniref:CU044_5270 family protein n=1 Tax=Sinosporangium siamense TaxID=1367973 RepID=A0A919RKX0_9ACTN|nr:CU044_5270 family protein [Sinosporangium siamense]GII95483.1 hypothetical protein Ssi02_57140 [Sinosporangium siamense]
MDEIKLFGDHPPAGPHYPEEAKRAARRRLLAEADKPRRTSFVFPRIGWQAVAAFGTTVVLVGGVTVALSSAGPRDVPPGAGTSQPAKATALPYGTSGELEPKPGQWIKVESRSSYRNKDDRSKKYIYTDDIRTTWRYYDETKEGLVFFGDSPSVRKAKELSPWLVVTADCPDWEKGWRPNYAYLSGLPTEAKAMRDVLDKRVAYEDTLMSGRGERREFLAFEEVHTLLQDHYVPRAQRAALFEAARSIPGVEIAEGVKDGDGRDGVSLAMTADGVRKEIIFAPETYLYLGARYTAVAGNDHDTPVGTVVGITTQRKTSVVDALPEVPKNALKDSSCDMAKNTKDGERPASDSPSPTSAPNE